MASLHKTTAISQLTLKATDGPIIVRNRRRPWLPILDKVRLDRASNQCDEQDSLRSSSHLVPRLNRKLIVILRGKVPHHARIVRLWLLRGSALGSGGGGWLAGGGSDGLAGGVSGGLFVAARVARRRRCRAGVIGLGSCAGARWGRREEAVDGAAVVRGQLSMKGTFIRLTCSPNT